MSWTHAPHVLVFDISSQTLLQQHMNAEVNSARLVSISCHNLYSIKLIHVTLTDGSCKKEPRKTDNINVLLSYILGTLWLIPYNVKMVRKVCLHVSNFLFLHETILHVAWTQATGSIHIYEGNLLISSMILVIYINKTNPYVICW